MGGGSHNPDSEIDDLAEAYSHIDSVGGHLGHGPGRNWDDDDMHPSTNPVPGGAQGRPHLGSRGTTNQMPEMSQWQDMGPDDPDRHHSKDLVALRKKTAELKEYLRSLSHLPPLETAREHAEAAVYLTEIKDDLIKLKRLGHSDGKPCHGMRERMDSIDFDRNQSRAGGRIDQSTQGHRESELSRPRNIRTEGRHSGDSGHGSRRPVAEADIASTTRGLQRLGVESHEGAQMPRGKGQTSHHHDLADYAGEESDYQLCGSCRDHHYPSAGHGHHPSRRPNHGMKTPSHSDNQFIT